MTLYFYGVQAQRRPNTENKPEVRGKNEEIIAANAIKGVEQEFFQAGMNDYVTKPIELKKLSLAMEPFATRLGSRR